MHIISECGLNQVGTLKSQSQAINPRQCSGSGDTLRDSPTKERKSEPEDVR